MKHLLQWAVPTLLIAGFLVITVSIKVVLNAREEVTQGHAALAAGETTRAAEHYERAVRWYLPGLGTSEEAAEALWGLAVRFEQQGQTQPALDTFRLLRGSFYATRHLFTPGQEWIDRCNAKIADLMARRPPKAEADRNRTVEERRTLYLDLLQRDRPPHTSWALLAEAGFLGWIGCLIGLLIQGFTRAGEVRSRFLLGWSGGFLLCYALWLFGLARV